MKLAFPNPTGHVFELSSELRSRGLEESRSSPRKRILLPIHRDQGALVQRMVNFLQPGTYVQPHLHPREGASETILVLEGALGFVIFDESGNVASVHRLAMGELIDIEPQVWHGVLALEPDTVILELKRGPYDDTDKTFAKWAPAEGEEGARAYLEELESLFTRSAQS
mgnify:CR=1 FL=1